MTDGISYGLGN